MASSFDVIDKADYPTSFKTLAEFNAAFMDAVARHDQALMDYLADNFAVSQDGVFFIGS